MSEKGANSALLQRMNAKETSLQSKSVPPQVSFNGLTASQNSSRGSSPSLYLSGIPSSQLPTSRMLPVTNSSINSVVENVSQLSLQNQSSSINKNKHVSSKSIILPDQIELQSSDIGSSLLKNDAIKNNQFQQHNFQEIPLNEDQNVSNSMKNKSDLQTSKLDNGLNTTEESLKNSYNSNLNKDSQLQTLNFNSNLFLKDQIRNFNVNSTLSHQPNSKSLKNSVENKVFQNEQQSVFQPPLFTTNEHYQESQNAMIQSRQYTTSSNSRQNIQAGPSNFNNLMYRSSSNYNATNLLSSQSNTQLYQNSNVKQENPRFVTNSLPTQKQPPLLTPFHQSPSKMIQPNFNLNAMSSQNMSSQHMSNNLKNNDAPLQVHPNIQMYQPVTSGGFASSTNQTISSIRPDISPIHLKKNLLTNRYPTLPAQRASSQPNLSSINNQQYSSQPIQNNKNFTSPTVYNQPQYHQSVVNQGFNKLWGAENYDLLQTSNILPSGKILPPQVTLGNDMLNSANCSSEIFRSTMTKIPESQSLFQKSRLPLGILIHPFKDLAQLSVIQCNVIVRCRACRTYINPFVFFIDSKRWKCNLCYRVNDLPEEFQFDPFTKTYGDPSRRPEIKSSTIEYIAPAEYMLRPPQPAVYLFLLDISRLAIESGYLHIFCKVLEEELSNLPGDSRTQVGFIAYNSCLHFFSLAEGLNQPHEMIVLDIDDIFLPCPDNLLVNLKDRTDLIRDLLKQLATRYTNSYDNNSALGAALQAAHRLMSPTGGRVTVFQANLPNIGQGSLSSREDPNQRAASEIQNLKPANDFYKRLALDCSSQQIAVDLFIVNSQYVDIATISGISRFSGGCIYHIPLFQFGKPIVTEKLEHCFKRYITRKIGFEAVMRIRCTRGLSIHTFHGNFFVRSTDLLSLPNVNPDSGYGMQISIDENLSDVENVSFQAALLYTSSKGERRIRVHTLCLPVVSTLHDVINSADQQCIIGLLAKMAVDRSIESSLSDAREAFINAAIDILSSYKLSLNLGSVPNGLLAPNCLKLLPLYISALLKHPSFRTGTSTRLDDRIKSMIDMKTAPLPWLIQNIYPDLYAIHNLEEHQAILNEEEEPVYIPPHLQLTSRLIDNNGAYLMDTGDHMMIYVCSGVSLSFLNDALGVQNFNTLKDQTYNIPMIENKTNRNLITFINYLNEEKPYRATLQIIKDNSQHRGVFLERLIEDRVENALSYHEFLQHVKQQVK